MSINTPLKTITDPVCKMPLASSNLRNVRSHNGELIYFCSENCAQKFDQFPLRYVGDVIRRLQVPVFGFTCASQAVGLEHRLSRIPGVMEITVNPVTEIAYFTYDSTGVDDSSLIDAIRRAGYRTE